jgi:hypothetical protein
MPNVMLATSLKDGATNSPVKASRDKKASGTATTTTKRTKAVNWDAKLVYYQEEGEEEGEMDAGVGVGVGVVKRDKTAPGSGSGSGSGIGSDRSKVAISRSSTNGTPSARRRTTLARPGSLGGGGVVPAAAAAMEKVKDGRAGVTGGSSGKGGSLGPKRRGGSVRSRVQAI